MNFLFETPLNMWKTSGELLQNKWEIILETIGEDPFHHYVTYSILMVMVEYWVLGAIFTLMDITNKPAFIRKYKIQLGTNEPVDTKRLTKVAINVVMNQTVTTFITSFILFKLSALFKDVPPVKELPTFLTVCLSFVFHLLTREIGFYYSHRLLHTKYLYKTIHKQHHEWNSPISIAANYCHPIEHILSNIIPILIGPAILQSHIVTTWIWITYSIIETLNTHSGLHLPFMPSAEFHDYHHLKFNQNYGGIGLMDWIHKTDEGFRKDIVFKRNYIIKSFTSARDVFPDVPKKTL